MTRNRFTEEVDSYTILRLRLTDFKPTSRTLPEGFTLSGPGTHPIARLSEKKLLREVFQDWEIPYRGKLKGWRDDSPIFVLKNGSPVGGLYLCAGNEFDEDKKWGQLHYFFVRQKLRGLGLHSLLVQEAISRARAWRLEGVYINTDRYGLPEVYIRWGAGLWKQIRKPSRLPRNSFGNLLRRVRRRGRILRQQGRITS